jgi:hypothetical protein
MVVYSVSIGILSARSTHHQTPADRSWQALVLGAAAMSLDIRLFFAMALGCAAVFAPAAEFAVERTSVGGVVVHVDGEHFAEYVVDQANKPYLWPIHGPSGVEMTRGYPMRMVEGEKRDHPHQRGLWFGHESIGGVDTWAEQATFDEHPQLAHRLAHLGRIRHREFREISGGAVAVVHAVADHLDHDGRPVLAEERRMTFGADADRRWIDVDLDLVAAHGPVTVADRKDAGLSIRVPHAMTVDAKQGGTIVNSAGQRDADAWAKRAVWCDFHGPVGGEHLGIAILNHPESFRHPTPWHARTYGLFTANPFGTRALDPAAPPGDVELAAGSRLRLRHRFVFHRGDEQQGRIAAMYAAYAAEPRPQDLESAACEPVGK